MGFKKGMGILLAFLMLSSNVGFAFSVHYCGGEISSVKPIFLPLEKGCCGKESKPMGCCKTKIVKSDKEHETVVKTFSFAFEAPFAPSQSVEIPFQTFASFTEKPAASYYCEANAPPLFKLHGQYIFYA
jgi:hypothetical protein